MLTSEYGKYDISDASEGPRKFPVGSVSQETETQGVLRLSNGNLDPSLVTLCEIYI